MEIGRFQKSEKAKPREGNKSNVALPSIQYFQLLNQNIPLMMEMQICTFFNPDLVWRMQFLPLIGPEEVNRLEIKLKELKVKGLDTLQVFYTSMFPNPPPHLENQFADLLRDIGSWPMVCIATLSLNGLPVGRL